MANPCGAVDIAVGHLAEVLIYGSEEFGAERGAARLPLDVAKAGNHAEKEIDLTGLFASGPPCGKNEEGIALPARQWKRRMPSSSVPSSSSS